MLDRFGNAVGEVLVVVRLDFLEGCQVAVGNVAARQRKNRTLAVERNIRDGDVIGDTATNRRPVRVETANDGDVDQIDVLHEVVEFVDPLFDGKQTLDGQHRLRISCQRVGHAADGNVLDVRRFRTEHGDDLVGITLNFERLQIVRRGDQVHFRRQFHRRVAPVTIGKNTELTGADKTGQAILDLGELGLAVARPVGEAFSEACRFARIGLQRAGDINPIERREVIKMHDVVMDGVRQNDQVADVLGIDRYLHLQCVFNGTHRGNRVHRRTDATDTLGDGPGIARISADEDVFNATPHLARSPGFGDLAAVYFDVDTQVAFDSGDWIDRYSFGHFLSPETWVSCVRCKHAPFRAAEPGSGG